MEFTILYTLSWFTVIILYIKFPINHNLVSELLDEQRKKDEIERAIILNDKIIKLKKQRVCLHCLLTK